MQRIPLYADEPFLPVQTCVPADVTRECELCPLHGAAGATTCIDADGEPGGLLVVGGAPTKQEAASNYPMASSAGQYVRQLIDRHWHGPVAYDSAVRCFPGSGAARHDPAAVVEECRPYLAQTLREVKPTRVLLLGRVAMLSVLDRSLMPMSVRRGVSWLYPSEHTDWKPVPVYLLIDPVSAKRNEFMRRQFERNLQHVLTCEPQWLPPWDAHANVVQTEADAQSACDALRAASWFAYDTETAGKMFSTEFRLLSVACCAEGSDTSYVWDATALADAACVAPLRDLLADQDVRKVGHNIKYDNTAVHLALDVEVEGMHLDTMLLRKLLDSDVQGGLDVCGEQVGMGGHKDEAQKAMRAGLRAFRKGEQTPLGENLAMQNLAMVETLGGIDPKDFSYALMPRDVLLRYNARDAVTTARLGTLLDERMKSEPQIDRIWRLVVKDASRAVEQIERWGMPCDAGRVAAFRQHLAQRISEAERTLPDDFNPNSVVQVRRLLFDTHHLPVIKRTDKGAPSTDKETLTLLSSRGHRIATDLLDWRRLTKLRGTYADGLAKHIRPDGRVHAHIWLDGARSGRTSSSDPNMQNVPRPDTPEGKMARDCFVAGDGNLLVNVDYATLELRVAAFLSGDPEMIGIFKSGVDYHQRTAEMVSRLAWGIAPEEVTKRHRSIAKGFNFGVIYGMSDAALAATLTKQSGIKVTIDDAERVRAAIMGKLRRLGEWINECRTYSMRTGVVHTWWDGEDARRRPLWDILDRDAQRQGSDERSSWNTRIQGTGSDFLLASMVKIIEWIEDTGVPAKLIMPVHDSFLFECSEDVVDEVIGKSREIMCSWNSGDVPLVVDAEVGKSWGSMSVRD